VLFSLALRPSHEREVATCGQGTGVYFGNGINTTALEADEVARDTLPDLAEEAGIEAPVTFAVAYNQTNGLFADVLETLEQKAAEDSRFSWFFMNNAVGYLVRGANVPTRLLDRVSGGEAFVAELQELINQLIADGSGHSTALYDSDVADHVAAYREELHEGNRVVVVAHSQGNLYANAARAQLMLAAPTLMNSFGVDAIATPAQTAADGYTTSDKDMVIGLLRELGRTVLPANVEVPFRLDDFLGHGFEEIYLNAQLPARTNVVSVLSSLGARLAFPPVSCDGSGGAGGAGGADGEQGGTGGPAPRYAGGWGDPHLYTWDGVHFDFHFVGEFELVRRGEGTLAQIRTAPLGTSQQVAVITAVAASVGPRRAAIYAGSPPLLTIDGEPAVPGVTSLGDGATASIDGIRWTDGMELSVRPYATHLDIRLSEPTGDITGLLGNANGQWSDDLALASGSAVPLPVTLDSLRSLANSWRITQDTSLLDYADGQTTLTFTDLTFPETIPSLLPEARAAARTTCVNAGVSDPVALSACILDVAMTGDAAFAAAAATIPPSECAAFPPLDWAWKVGSFSSEADDPVDAQQIPWYEADFDDSAYIDATVPHTGIPAGQGAVYRAKFDLTEVPESLSLSLRSDDGLWLYVNGTLIGQWGAAWLAGGCVNGVGCSIDTVVPPVSIVPYLATGANVVAVRVSNGGSGSYFDASGSCHGPAVQ
jgi:hypothetical protein